MTEQTRRAPDDPRAISELAAVLDASAVLALLLGEPGADAVADAIAGGVAISSVTHAEVGTVLARNGWDRDGLALVAGQTLVEPFSLADALTAAALITATSGLGLSLGDRACLALAQRLRAPALTAERAWAKLDVEVEIIVIGNAEP
jgi:PIN domain nuclease of toxin-antitoxin system